MIYGDGDNRRVRFASSRKDIPIVDIKLDKFLDLILITHNVGQLESACIGEMIKEQHDTNRPTNRLKRLIGTNL